MRDIHRDLRNHIVSGLSTNFQGANIDTPPVDYLSCNIWYCSRATGVIPCEG